MANVIHPHPQIDLYPGPVNLTSSPCGFGFGLSSSSLVNWPTPGTHGAFMHSATIQPLASTLAQPARTLKRRHEHDDEHEGGSTRHHSPGAKDVAMDRSPTPERPKRAVPKRARTTPAASGSKDNQNCKENKASGSEDNDVDVGVLLASLPPQSLLPLLNALVSHQPSLKPLVLSLIPRPSLETAIQALAQCAKKLRDAYPYSNSTHNALPTSLGFGFGSSFNSRQSSLGSSPIGFGRPSPTPQPSGFSTPSSSDSNGGMREEYIVSRLRPHIDEFVSACLAYLPYFSYLPAPTSHPISLSSQAATPNVPLLQPKERPHPTEAFQFLSTLTTHVLQQPPLAQASLAPALLPRLLAEWRAWIDRVDEIANKEGGMFGGETVRTWERDLDTFAEAKGHGLEAFKEVRDRWVGKVGWLVGRMLQPMMEV